MTPRAEFHIYRHTWRRLDVAEAVASLRADLCTTERSDSGSASSLLLRAGELECGLLDADAPAPACLAASALTDLFARVAVARDRSGNDCGLNLAAALPLLDPIVAPGEISVGVPEGFAYYAIHPLDYADLVERIAFRAPAALVVGIRSIGTTLSAVVTAKLRELGVAAHRLTVRPTGSPYDRVCALSSQQQQTIAEGWGAGAEFVICDEGPGRSGSSFLSVAETLECEGVSRDRILMLCSYEPDVSSLCAREAERRWRRFRSEAAGMTRRQPAEAAEYLGGGEWRLPYCKVREDLPPVWPQMEPLAYGSRDRSTLWLFEGHGPYGERVRRRSQALASAGYAPEYFGQEAGFGRHAIVRARVLQRQDLTPQLLMHMANYCAWRAREFRVDDANGAELEAMALVNFEREFGGSLKLEGFSLPVERPTICDTRMMPGSWLETSDGQWRKLDGALHGDDHFFPGPCDIAWDLAGIVVEWELSDSQREFLLARYKEASGDDGSARLSAYEAAYATFRMAWSAMAASSVGTGEPEQELLSDYRRYRECLSARTNTGRFSKATCVSRAEACS